MSEVISSFFLFFVLLSKGKGFGFTMRIEECF